jgi:hypothetical protein
MPNPQDAPGNLIDRTRTVANVLTVVSQALVSSVEVPLHKGFGPRYFGLASALAFVIIPLFSVFWPMDDCRPLLWYTAFYAVMSGVGRMGPGHAGRSAVHSRYNGVPRLARLLPRMSEEAIKRKAEPALVFGLGLSLLALNPPLGSYLLTCSLAMVAMGSMEDAYGRRRAMDLYDGFLDNQDLAERFRRMRGEHAF